MIVLLCFLAFAVLALLGHNHYEAKRIRKAMTRASAWSVTVHYDADPSARYTIEQSVTVPPEQAKRMADAIRRLQLKSGTRLV